MRFALCLIIWAVVTFADEEILTNISPRVYIEDWGEVAIIEKHAQIWIKMDINELLDEIVQIEKFRSRVYSTCNQAFQMTNDLDTIGFTKI